MFNFSLEYGLDEVPNISPAMDDEEKPKWIAKFLKQQNKRIGRRPYGVIPQQEFLGHKPPQPKHDGTIWGQAWRDLRSMYAQGEI